MTKKEIKDILKEHGYKMITPSWYAGKKAEKSAIFTAYDKGGTVFHFFVNWGGTSYSHKPYALRQMVSNICIHEKLDVTSMFFGRG